MGNVIIYEMPELNSPYLVAGFEGWPDAGRISTGVIGYLRDKLKAEKFAEIKPDAFYVFQSPGAELLRPLTVIENGLIKELSLPSTGFWAWRNEKAMHDLILLLGIEPHLRWNEYTDSILDFAQEFGVNRIYTVGGTYDMVPHTREPIISAVVNDPGLGVELRKYDIESTEYKGPSSVHTLLLLSAGKRNLKAASLWGHAPHYIQVPNAKVCYSMLIKLTAMLEIELDLEDIRKASEYLDEQVNKAIEQKPELGEYVKRLEGKHRFGEPLAEDIIKEVEDFLRKSTDGEE